MQMCTLKVLPYFPLHYSLVLRLVLKDTRLEYSIFLFCKRRIKDSESKGGARSGCSLYLDKWSRPKELAGARIALVKKTLSS